MSEKFEPQIVTPGLDKDFRTSKPNYTLDPYENPLPDLQPAPASKTVAEQQEEYRARVADGMWPDANVEDRLRLLADVERLTRQKDGYRDALGRVHSQRDRMESERDAAERKALIAENERDRLRALLRDAARQIRSDSGPCPVDMTSRVGLLLTRIDLQLKDSSDETKARPIVDLDAEQGFEAGWRAATAWTDRDDLLWAIGSSAYHAAMTEEFERMSGGRGQQAEQISSRAGASVGQPPRPPDSSKKASDRPSVKPPKFCAVDECYNRVAEDQEVCDSCSQNGSENPTGE